MTRRQNTLGRVVVGANATGSALSIETETSSLHNSNDNDNDAVLTPLSDTSTMTDAFGALTTGALRQICDGQQVDNPIVQCVQIKPMAANQQTGQERWRVVFNDSVNFIQGMIAIQSNYLITDGTLKKGSVCRLTQYQANFVKDKHILIIVALDVLSEYGEPDKLGQPVAIEGAKPEAQQDVKPQPGNIAGNGFYGNKPQGQPQQQQQQQQSLSARPKGTLTHGGHANITPIEAVSPYTHKWTIKARCTHKGDIKTWHNKNGEGKLFSANFLDDSGEIRATGFNDSVDQWYEFLQEGNVYYISSPCKVQLAKKQFSTVNNDYELTFERDTVVEKAEDHEGVPQVRYNFTNIEALQNIEKDSTIDCIGVLSDVGEVSEIVSKNTNKPYSKRELTLVDDSGYNVRLTVWGKTAESFDARPESVVAFKGVKVSDFGGRSLSLLASGSMNVDPDIEEAYKLKGWYDGAGRTENFASHANSMATAGATSGGKNDFRTISAVYDEKIGQTETTDWFSIKATIVYVKQDSFAYPACRTTDPQPCNKKVLEADEGNWRCEKCDKTWDAPNYRYIMSVNVSDHTGQIWLSCFDEVGVAIMGMPANELMAMKEEGDDKRVGEVFSDANCKTFNFKCRAKMDNFQDQQRVRYQVQYANVLDFSRETKKLTDLLKQYSLQENSMFV